VLLLALHACDSPTASETRLLQTAEASYALVADEGGIGVAIDYTFLNQTGHTVYLPNCKGVYFFRLERLEGGAWASAWDPDRFLCLSPPIVIEAEQSFSDTVQVWGSHDDPEMQNVRAGGTFRVVWTAALSSEDEPFSEALIPLEYRVSNSFVLLEP
jgi:hypothetical protein